MVTTVGWWTDDASLGLARNEAFNMYRAALSNQVTCALDADDGESQATLDLDWSRNVHPDS